MKYFYSLLLWFNFLISWKIHLFQNELIHLKKKVFLILHICSWWCDLHRKTVFGPSYGSPVKKMAILPASKDGEPNSRYMAYITQDKV